MIDSNYNYEELRHAVEKSVGRKMRTPKDFDFLAMRIYDINKSQISPTTLKRFWGYIDKNKEVEPRRFTLDTLSIVVGYKDYETFCTRANSDGCISSDFVKSPCLYSTSLHVGNIVKLYWQPNRCVTLRYMGEDLFEVLESINSKLCAGDRFCCGCIIDGEPLYLTRLQRNNEVLGGYVCGQNEGIKYSISNRSSGGGNTL